MPRRHKHRRMSRSMKKEMMGAGMRGNGMHDCCGGHGWHHHWHKRCMGGGYGLGFIGALVYYIQTATGFWPGVLGVLKAIVWPAFLVYKLLGM